MKRNLNAYAWMMLVGTLLLVAFTLPGSGKVNIIFIGDSITQGSDQPPLQPSVYALKYLSSILRGVVFSEVNAGVSGRTTLDFLPGQKNYKKAQLAADSLYADTNAQLLFSIMLGTNDSAIKGPNGAPVSTNDYKANLKLLIDTLLQRYPNSKVVIHRPVWYSPNTYNGAIYLAEGLARLQRYFPEIDGLANDYRTTHPGHVFAGDKDGFAWFENNYAGALQQEQGHQGIFYLHPNARGAAHLGELWGKAIVKALK